MAAVDVPENPNPKSNQHTSAADGGRPPVYEMLTQAEKREVLEEGLEAVDAEMVVKEFKDEVLRDLHHERMLKILAGDQQPQVHATANILINHSGY